MKGKSEMHQDAFLVEKLCLAGSISILEQPEVLTGRIRQDFNMGEGEAATIAVAIREQAIAATDNRQGRKAAAINHIPLVGSPEIIVGLFKKKKIGREKALAAVKSLKKEGWFDHHLIEKTMEDLYE